MGIDPEEKRMDEREIDVQLNKTTKLVLRGVPGRSSVLEIRRAVNTPRFGHGWLVESQVMLDDRHVAMLRDALDGLMMQSQHVREDVV
jgi:hypothetical protein